MCTFEINIELYFNYIPIKKGMEYKKNLKDLLNAVQRRERW